MSGGWPVRWYGAGRRQAGQSGTTADEVAPGGAGWGETRWTTYTDSVGRRRCDRVTTPRSWAENRTKQNRGPASDDASVVWTMHRPRRERRAHW